jgi:2-phospho-L-lactate guanylyltransferase
VTAVVLIPVKAFHLAKVRLAPALDPGARSALARQMATKVVASAAGLAVAVVCDDPEVAAWAATVGAEVISEPGIGLNGAVQHGVAHLGQRGADVVIVAAADLPLATDLAWTARFPGVTIIPDRRRDGTNVIAVPSAAGFTFSYGPGSFSRHLGEARRLGLATRVVHSSPLGWDVDVPDDLAVLPV